jgi:hypothetical protein
MPAASKLAMVAAPTHRASVTGPTRSRWPSCSSPTCTDRTCTAEARASGAVASHPRDKAGDFSRRSGENSRRARPRQPSHLKRSNQECTVSPRRSPCPVLT